MPSFLWHGLCKDGQEVSDGTVRQEAMSESSTNDERERAFTAQAIIDLTEANVSASGHGDEWQREVAFLHDSTDGAPNARSTDLDEMVEFATALA